jgi:hypothetical protein
MPEWVTPVRGWAVGGVACLVLLVVACLLLWGMRRDRIRAAGEDEHLTAALRAERDELCDYVDTVVAVRVEALLAERLPLALAELGYVHAAIALPPRHDRIPDLYDGRPEGLDYENYDGLPANVVDTGDWVTDTVPVDWLPAIQCPPAVVIVAEDTEVIPYIDPAEVAPIFEEIKTRTGEYPTVPPEDPDDGTPARLQSGVGWPQ